MKRKSLILLVAATVLGVGAVGAFVIPSWSEVGEAREIEPAAEEPDPTPVSVAEARVGPVALHLTTTSAVEAERTAQVLSETSGVLTEVRVREGDSVTEGQVLARVDARERRLALQQAELRLSRADAELSRQQRAFDQDLVSEWDYEKARFDRDLAASELETARLELDRTEIRAPFAGKVTEVLLVEGGRLEPAQHLLTLADFNTLVARLYVPERDVIGLTPGLPAIVRPESDATGAGITGRIREVSPVVDRSTGTVKVTVALPSPSGAVVRPGSFARVTIETGRRENAVLAPKRAIIQNETGSHVFVVEEGKAVRRDVTVGVEMESPGGALIELSDGLEAGTRIVVAGHGALNPGSPVEILNGN
jgi:RND family efflux transporter MFP subunit